MRVSKSCGTALALLSSAATAVSTPPLFAQVTFVDSAAAALIKAPAPVDYVLQKFAQHRIVLIGEPHWVAHDVGLVQAIVPRLPDAHVNTIAVEWIRANQQSEVNAVMAAPAWQDKRAIALLRNSGWPYAEYLELVKLVWRTNHESPAARERLFLLAFGPDADWRARLLPLGKNAEEFMADRLRERIDAAPTSRILVYMGFHHAFTRFLQPDLPGGTRATRFNDRTGNILWRWYGEDVFTIVLHHPWFCRADSKWGRCLPVNAMIDCVGDRLGHSFAVDVATSPFAPLRVGRNIWYGAGQPFLRLDNLVDGYVWTKPIENYQGVAMIPLSAYAPDEESLRQVLADNPVSDEPAKTRAELEIQWRNRAAELRNSVASRGWSGLSEWRRQCSAAPDR